jgi:hypothetical protein
MKMAATGDAEAGESVDAQARKHSAIVRDLGVIMKSITVDNKWEDSELTKLMKTATPQTIEHMARLITFNHLLPANHYLNAELMYKSVMPGADKEAIRSKIITDSKMPDIRDTNTIVGKTAKLRPHNPLAYKNAISDINTESDQVHNYRQAKRYLDTKRKQNTSGERFARESMNTQARKVNHKNYEIVDKNSQIGGITMGENLYAERHSGRIGSKYTMRNMDRDGRINSELGIGA